MYRRINFFNNNTTVVHDKTKLDIICLERNPEHLLSNYQFLMNKERAIMKSKRSEAKQLIKSRPNQGAWSRPKRLKPGTVQHLFVTSTYVYVLVNM